MRAVVVVRVAPVFGHAPHLVERGKHIAVEHLGAVSSVEAFDVGVLGVLAGVDVNEIHGVALGPFLERGADELLAVVQPQTLRRAALVDQ